MEKEKCKIGETRFIDVQPCAQNMWERYSTGYDKKKMEDMMKHNTTSLGLPKANLEWN